MASTGEDAVEILQFRGHFAALLLERQSRREVYNCCSCTNTTYIEWYAHCELHTPYRICLSYSMARLIYTESNLRDQIRKIEHSTLDISISSISVTATVLNLGPTTHASQFTSAGMNE